MKRVLFVLALVSSTTAFAYDAPKGYKELCGEEKEQHEVAIADALRARQGECDSGWKGEAESGILNDGFRNGTYEKLFISETLDQPLFIARSKDDGSGKFTDMRIESSEDHKRIKVVVFETFKFESENSGDLVNVDLEPGRAVLSRIRCEIHNDEDKQ